MNYQILIEGMKKYGSSERDICIHGIGVAPELVNEKVIIAPWWEPPTLPELGDVEYLSESQYASVKVWNITNNKFKMTYIKTGIGAPVVMDVMLSLGVTNCRKAIFVGSVGSIDETIGIGDIVIPAYSICGDGASRYIGADILNDTDVFGSKAYPDLDLYTKVYRNAELFCKENGVKYHIGKTYSIDTIFAQFAHIDEIIQMGCNVIEMETAAAFLAANMCNISLAAIFSVSDNTVTKKSLVSGRTEKEMEYRRFTRKSIIPKIILNTFMNDTQMR